MPFPPMQYLSLKRSLSPIRYNRDLMPVLGLNPNFRGIYFSAVAGPMISRNKAPMMAKWCIA